MRSSVLSGFFLLWLFSITLQAQTTGVTVSGTLRDQTSGTAMPYVNVVLRNETDSTFVSGTISDEQGLFSIPGIAYGEYYLTFSYLGYRTQVLPLRTGQLSPFLDLGNIQMTAQSASLSGVTISGKQDELNESMDKKTYHSDENISQSGGSALQVMRNLPGVTIDPENRILIRGSDKVTILVDGRQTALSGFGNQAGLDNIPASAIERIEIIHNPSAKYDANGNAGIINIILKKNKQDGFNGKAGLTAGIGALWRKRENLPDIRPQYRFTPKINPTLSLNYRRRKFNLFLQGDLLWQKILNKNEFTDRYYDNGSIIHQQYQENRTQLATTVKAGVDWFINDNNTVTLSMLYGREAHVDRGDLPYFNNDFSQRERLWTFYEHEVNTTLSAAAIFLHKFRQPGHQLTLNLNYSFQREDENYFIRNEMPTYTGLDSLMLIADQHVADLNIDYVKPLRRGRIESGMKFRWRYIPTHMRFIPGLNSPMDAGAAGWANYSEIIPALYTNYVYESKHFEAEAGVRVEYVNVRYQVDPNHNTYKSDGYSYIQPFPNVRLAYIINDRNRLSLFYNRRVDRPDEQDLRIFPKYDDPEILKTGNPGLRPQFTQSAELGYKTSWKSGYFYSAFYYRNSNRMLTRIATADTAGNIIYSIAQNAGNGHSFGLELILNQELTKWFSLNISGNVYQNTIGAFTVENLYPFPVFFSSPKQQTFSGNAKMNLMFRLPKKFELWLSGIYLAPDIIPQGRIRSRYSVDLGLRKSIQKGKGELLLNMSDIFNTMRIRQEIRSDGFRLVSSNYYETQVIRFGYSYTF
ncbi:MAG: TonB-dependent receptor [Bacteroidia bacterium]|nr:TonB-dependent receptor [Bacteroidia bacterium]